MQQLKLSLHENAHDFLEDALANAVVAEESPKRWKFAILSMVQAIELALKELLAEVHPLFVYENVDRATRTVGLDQAVKRLGTVANLQLTADESEALRIAKEARDQIVHYEVDANVEQLKLSFSRLLGFLADFYDAHFDMPLHDHIDSDLWSKGVSIQAYGKELYERAVRRIAENLNEEQDVVVACPYCRWKSMLVRDDGEGTCYVCGRVENITFCDRCDVAMVTGEEEEEHGKKYCRSCFEYVSSDYWYEQRAGK